MAQHLFAEEFTPLRNVQRPLQEVGDDWQAEQVAHVAQTVEGKPGEAEAKRRINDAFKRWIGKHTAIIKDYREMNRRKRVCSAGQQQLMGKLHRIPGANLPEDFTDLTPDEVDGQIEDIVESRHRALKLGSGVSLFFMAGKFLVETALALPFVHNGLVALDLDWNAVTGLIAMLIAAILGLIPQTLFHFWYSALVGVSRSSQVKAAPRSSDPPGHLTMMVDNMTEHSTDTGDPSDRIVKGVLFTILTAGIGTAAYTWWMVDTFTFGQRLSEKVAPGMALVTTLVLFLTGMALAIMHYNKAQALRNLRVHEADMRKCIEKEHTVIRQAWMPQEQIDVITTRMNWLIERAEDYLLDIEALDLSNDVAVQKTVQALREDQERK